MNRETAPPGGVAWEARDRSRPTVDLKTVGFMALEALVAWGCVAVAVLIWEPLVVIGAMVVVATRQHALFILFHDAVHYLVARDKRVNDAITNALIGVPQLVPVQLYRRLHLAHHARLGTDADPERLLLYRGQPWQYRPLPMRTLVRQILGDLLLLNNLKTLWYFGRESADPRSRLALPTARTHPEFYLTVALWGVLLGIGLWQSAELTGRVLLVWLVPLLTLTQAIQKIRSFLEHAGPDSPELTYSWRPGLLGRLIVWPYHIQYHREHHLQPRVPWHALPERFAAERPTPVRWWRVLWDGTW